MPRARVTLGVAVGGGTGLGFTSCCRLRLSFGQGGSHPHVPAGEPGPDATPPPPYHAPTTRPPRALRSFARGQNEDVISAFLQAEPSASLVPVESLRHAPCREGALRHTLRFDPMTSQTSGLFVAKLTKAEGGGGSLADSSVVAPLAL